MARLRRVLDQLAQCQGKPLRDQRGAGGGPLSSFRSSRKLVQQQLQQPQLRLQLLPPGMAVRYHRQHESRLRTPIWSNGWSNGAVAQLDWRQR